MSNISRSYPFQPQYKSLIDSHNQPEKTTEQEITEVDKSTDESLLAVLDDIDDLILQMQQNRRKLCEQPALCEFFLELIYTHRSELNKKMLEDQLAFFDSSGELVRKENHGITQRIVQLLDLETELDQIESKARESGALILTPAEQKALMRQLAKTSPIVKFGETYYSVSDVINSTPTHEAISGGVEKLFEARTELVEVMQLIEASLQREYQQLFSITLKKLVSIQRRMDAFIKMLHPGAEVRREHDDMSDKSERRQSCEAAENSKMSFYKSLMELIQRWENKVTYFNTQYVGLLIALSSLTPQNDTQRFDISSIGAMLTVLQDIAAIKDNMAAMLGGVTETDLTHLLEDIGINSGELVGSIALINIGSDVANMLKDAMLGCFITLQTAQERQGMMTPEQLSNLNNMMAHFGRVIKKIASLSSTKNVLGQLIKTAESLLSLLAKMFR